MGVSLLDVFIIILSLGTSTNIGLCRMEHDSKAYFKINGLSFEPRGATGHPISTNNMRECELLSDIYLLSRYPLLVQQFTQATTHFSPVEKHSKVLTKTPQNSIIRYESIGHSRETT